MAAEGDTEQKGVLIDVMKSIISGQLPLEGELQQVGMFSAELASELHRIALKLLMSP